MAEGGEKDVGSSAEPTLTKQQLDQIVNFLKKSSEYVVMTKDEYNSFTIPLGASSPAPTEKQAAKPKMTDSHINSVNFSHMQAQKYNTPKLPCFSGDQPPLKGDESFSVWRFETRCLISEHFPEHVSLQVLRKSLRGTARRALIF